MRGRNHRNSTITTLSTESGCKNFSKILGKHLINMLKSDLTINRVVLGHRNCEIKMKLQSL